MDCEPIAKPDGPAGVTDNALCLEGNGCNLSVNRVETAGKCTVFTNLGTPEDGSKRAGVCMPIPKT